MHIGLCSDGSKCLQWVTKNLFRCAGPTLSAGCDHLAPSGESRYINNKFQEFSVPFTCLPCRFKYLPCRKSEIHLMTPFLEFASLSSNIGMPQPAPQSEDSKKGEECVRVLERRKDNYIL